MKDIPTEIDAFMMRYYSAEQCSRYGGNIQGVIAYESAGQRFLVEIRDGKWTVFTFHSNGESK